MNPHPRQILAISRGIPQSFHAYDGPISREPIAVHNKTNHRLSLHLVGLTKQR